MSAENALMWNCATHKHSSVPVYRDTASSPSASTSLADPGHSGASSVQQAARTRVRSAGIRRRWPFVSAPLMRDHRQNGARAVSVEL